MLTNQMIDNAILNSNNPCNSVGLMIPFDYAVKEVQLNWSDILYAIENRFFDDYAAIEYALLQIENADENSILYELACLRSEEINHEELLTDYLYDLVEAASPTNREESQNKILYLLLKLVYENKQLFEDPLRVVDIIYDDFGFPEKITKFVSYMPTDEMGGIERLYQNWEEYLVEEGKKYKNETFFVE